MKTKPVENKTAGAARAPSPAEWKHENLRLKLGRSYYLFRTLSFLEAVQIEPLIGPILELVKDGNKGEEFARQAIRVLKVICPTILNEPDDLKELGQVQVQELWKFYSAQDWSRLHGLRALRGGGDDQEDSGEEGHDRQTTFYLLCAAGAAQERCSGMEFMDLRFERAADCFMAMHSQWQKNEDSKPKPADMLQFFASGDNTSKFNPDARPAWMTALEPEPKPETEKD